MPRMSLLLIDTFALITAAVVTAFTAPALEALKVINGAIASPHLLLLRFNVVTTAPWLVTPTIPPAVAVVVVPRTVLLLTFTVPNAAVFNTPNMVIDTVPAPVTAQFNIVLLLILAVAFAFVPPECLITCICEAVALAKLFVNVTVLLVTLLVNVPVGAVVI